MGVDERGHPLGLHHGTQQPHDLLRRLRVELAGGLVGQQHLRAAGQRPGDRDPLLLASGQLARPLPGVLTEPDDVQRRSLGWLILVAGSDLTAGSVRPAGANPWMPDGAADAVSGE